MENEEKMENEENKTEERFAEEDMVKVQAGKYNFYLDGYLKSNLDALKKNVKKDYDAFILLVGREGFGKTTLAFQVAVYCDPTFNLSRVCFTAEQFLDAVANAEKNQSIVFDETMGYLSSRSGMSRFNKALIKVMSEMRSKNLFVFLNIPNFWMMDWYVSQHRTTGLLYIYKRSFFGSYDYPTKKNLYMQGKKYHIYSVPPNFRGRFVKYFPFDKQEYELKKQQAINSWASETKLESLWKKQRDILIRLCVNNNWTSTKELAEQLGMSVRQIQQVVSDEKR